MTLTVLAGQKKGAVDTSSGERAARVVLTRVEAEAHELYLSCIGHQFEHRSNTRPYRSLLNAGQKVNSVAWESGGRLAHFPGRMRLFAPHKQLTLCALRVRVESLRLYLREQAELLHTSYDSLLFMQMAGWLEEAANALAEVTG